MSLVSQDKNLRKAIICKGKLYKNTKASSNSLSEDW